MIRYASRLSLEYIVSALFVVYLRSKERGPKVWTATSYIQGTYKVRVRYTQGTYKVEGSMCGCLLVDFNIVFLGLHCLYIRYV